MDNSFISKRLFCILRRTERHCWRYPAYDFVWHCDSSPCGRDQIRVGPVRTTALRGRTLGSLVPGGRPGLHHAFRILSGALGRATERLAGWMTLFGATLLMTVSLIEITCYISALFPDPEMMTSISLRVISAVQHLYFIVGAPAVFCLWGLFLLLPRSCQDCLDIWPSFWR
jgi:hypothetical protein